VRGAVNGASGGGKSTCAAMPGLFLLVQLPNATALFLACLGSSATQRLFVDGAEAFFLGTFFLRVSD